MSGNQLKYLAILEGRFSPKDNQEINAMLIENILRGQDLLIEKQ